MDYLDDDDDGSWWVAPDPEPEVDGDEEEKGGEEQGVQGETIVVQRSGTLICSRTSLTCRCTRTI